MDVQKGFWWECPSTTVLERVFGVMVRQKLFWKCFWWECFSNAVVGRNVGWGVRQKLFWKGFWWECSSKAVLERVFGRRVRQNTLPIGVLLVFNWLHMSWCCLGSRGWVELGLWIFRCPPNPETNTKLA